MHKLLVASLKQSRVMMTMTSHFTTFVTSICYGRALPMIFFNHSSLNNASRRLEAESPLLISSKNPLDAFSLLDFRSLVIDSSISVQYLPCFTGLSATINLFPSRVLSEKPAQTEDNHD